MNPPPNVLGVERRAHRVDDPSLRHASRGHLPDFLDAGGVDLRGAAFVQLQLRREPLGQRAAYAFAEDGDLGPDVRPGLEVGLPISVPVDSLVAGPNADHPVPLEEALDRGHSREDVGAGRLDQAAQPFLERAERDDVVAVVLEGRRKDGEADLAARREVIEIVARDVALDGRALLAIVGEEFLERAWIQHAAGDPVGADLGRLFQHRDRHFAERRAAALRRALVVRGDELGEFERAREAGGASANEEDVDLEGLRSRGGGLGGLRRARGGRGVFQRLEVPLGVQRGHASAAGGGHGLAVHVVLDVARGENARNIGARALAGARCSPRRRAASWPWKSSVLGWWPIADEDARRSSSR